MDAARWNDVATEFPQCADFYCPITSRVMIDPVWASDGFTYERAAIEEWFQTKDVSPQRDIAIVHAVDEEPSLKGLRYKELTPNDDLRLAIVKFKALLRGVEEGIVEWDPSGRQKEGGRRFIPATTSAAWKKLLQAASTPTAATPAHESKDMSSAMSKVFKYLDPLRDLLASVLDGWTPPAIVVLGDESAGKSTILEQLVMLPVFPRKKLFCTRLAIHVHVGLSARKPPNMSLRLVCCRSGSCI